MPCSRRRYVINSRTSSGGAAGLGRVGVGCDIDAERCGVLISVEISLPRTLEGIAWIDRIQDVATIMMSFESQRSGVRSLNATFVSSPTARLGIDSSPLTDVTDAI